MESLPVFRSVVGKDFEVLGFNEHNLAELEVSIPTA
jgi:hypothetical protein